LPAEISPHICDIYWATYLKSYSKRATTPRSMLAIGSVSAQPNNSTISRGLEGAPKKAAPSCDVTPKDPAIWDKFITAGFNYTDGNSKTTTLNLNGKVMRDYQGDAWRFEADYNYGNAAADGETTREVNKNNFRAL
jgi:hypothetical protein